MQQALSTVITNVAAENDAHIRFVCRSGCMRKSVARRTDLICRDKTRRAAGTYWEGSVRLEESQQNITSLMRAVDMIPVVMQGSSNLHFLMQPLCAYICQQSEVSATAPAIWRRTLQNPSKTQGCPHLAGTFVPATINAALSHTVHCEGLHTKRTTSNKKQIARLVLLVCLACIPYRCSSSSNTSRQRQQQPQQQ
mmetsp:Transcript_110342/g.213677  ORF Transcript_110342/g.213677 Transcript_110342/m.213677 type:complete len:195 (+) Transcript_110342:189-773(+)